MAVRLTAASTQYLHRTATVFSYNAAYTFAGWVYFTSVTADMHICSLNVGAGGYDRAYINDAAGDAWGLEQIGGTGDNNTNSSVVAGAWYFAAMVRVSATDLRLYTGTTPANVALQIQLTAGNTAGRAANTDIAIGRPFSGFSTLNGRVRGWRAYTSALSLGELQTEAASIDTAVKAGAWDNWALAIAGTYTGTLNARTLSANGTPTTETPDPVVASRRAYLTWAEMQVPDAAAIHPVAAFTPVVTDQTVVVTDGSTDADGTVVGWSWDFGDGQGLVTTQNASHVYTTPGTYTITLTVTDNQTLTGSVSHVITLDAPPNPAPVPNPPTPSWVVLGDIRAQLTRAVSTMLTASFQGRTQLRPVADFGAAVSSTNPLTVSFADASFDPKGGSIATWAWDFGDGDTSAVQNPNHTYTAAGSYAVTLIVTDNSGLYGSSIAVQTLVEPDDPAQTPLDPPVASFTVGKAGLVATFTDTSTDSDGTIVDWTWNFGQGPSVNFSTSISLLQVTFTDASTDDGSIASRLWTFGDGATSAATNPVHTYALSGNYTVTLTATDNEGNTGTHSATVAVTSGSVTLGRPLGAFSLWTGASKPTSGTASFNMSLDANSATSIVAKITAAAAASHGLVLAMTGGSHSNYTTAGAFDIVKWQSKMQTYNTTAIKAAIAAGVINRSVLGCSIMDEPQHSDWGGIMTKALLDSMATYVKGIFPTLPVGVVHGGLPDYRVNEHYTVMDFVECQFWRRQSRDLFLTQCLALEAADGVRLLLGINVIDGGTDLAGCPLPTTGGPGTFGGHCRDTAAQVQSDGLFFSPYGVGLIIWRYDTDMFPQAAYLASFAAIKADLLTRVRAPIWTRP